MCGDGLTTFEVNKKNGIKKPKTKKTRNQRQHNEPFSLGLFEIV